MTLGRHIPRPLVVVLALLAIIVLVTILATEPVSALENETHEPAFEEPVPEPGDEYYEARAADDSWISYINPRDEYRSPYLGESSGKICVTLLNAAGEPIIGESIPNTTVTVPTGETLEWHSHADPFEVTYPLTNVEQPLDADQFGTHPDLPQGDGWLDSHCLEFHGVDENATISYGEPTISGDHTDDVELVGLIQQDGEAWDSAVDPLEDAQPFESVPGEWTNEPDASHGQVVVVLQLDHDHPASATLADSLQGPLENATLSGEPEEERLSPVWVAGGAVLALTLAALMVAIRRQ